MAYQEGRNSDSGGGIVVDGPILSSNDIYDINDNSDQFMIPSSAFDDSAKLFADDGNDDVDMDYANHYSSSEDDDESIIKCNFPSFMPCGGSSSRHNQEREQFMKRFPKNEVVAPTLEQVETTWNKLLKDREGVSDEKQSFLDIQGISASPNESSETMEELLEAMEYELIQVSRHTAYETAMNQNPTYVKDVKFRKAFLRAEMYNPRKAAHRLVRFCEEKLALFGPDR